MCNCSNLYHICNNNFFIFICLQLFCKPHLSQPFCKQYTYSLDLYNRELQTGNRNLSQGWLNSNWILLALSGSFIYACLQSAVCSLSIRCIILPSRELYSDRLYYVHSHDVFISMYLDHVDCAFWCVHLCCICVISRILAKLMHLL